MSGSWVLVLSRTSAILAIVALASCDKDDDSVRAAPPANPAPSSAAATTNEAETEVAGPFNAQSLGALEFPVTGGNETARAHFRRGLLALHSFWYEEARSQFEAAIAADPSFQMGYWGLAMSHCKLLWGDDNLAAAREAMGRMPDAKSLSPREQAWVLATVALIGAGDVISSRKKFAVMMERVHEQFPDDESATFLAAALLSSSRPEDPNHMAIRQRAANLAGLVFNRNPKHPGAAHYLIHALDTPQLARRGLPAAGAYALIAPEAYHARHMPAHIYTRLAMFEPALESCESAWQASLAWTERVGLSRNHHDYHSLSWLVELNFELGRRKKADEAMKRFADAVRAGVGTQVRTAYAQQVSSYMARTGEWDRVDELLAPLDAPAVEDQTPSTSPGAACASQGPLPAGSPLKLFEERAVLAARIRAASHRRDLAATQKWLAKKDAVDAKVQAQLRATQPPELVVHLEELAAKAREATLARARGDDAALVVALEPLAEAEDREMSSEGAAEGNLPREEMAEAFMRLGRVNDAGREFQKVLAIYPGRARTLLGFARAAVKAGDAATAKKVYQKLAAQWEDADATTEGLDEVRGGAR